MPIVWNAYLVALSVLIAMLGSFSALSHTEHMRENTGKTAFLWMSAGAVTLGMAIWAMHFIGMLAFHLPIPIGYDISLTLLSILPAIVATLIGFHLLQNRAVRFGRIVLAGTLMGLGIAIMHYTGMAALKMQPAISYDPLIFVLSIVIAIVAAIGALLIVFVGNKLGLSSFKQQSFGALIMGFAIAGMHYTAMQGASFAVGSFCAVGGRSVEPTLLALIVTSAVLLLFSGGSFASLVDRRIALDRLLVAHATLKARGEHIEYLANFDPLTGLPNRNLCMNRLEQALLQARRTQSKLGLMFLDIDRFKYINDNFGHAFGDSVLKEFGSRLIAILRDGDTVARLGGDEFVIILADIKDPEDAACVAMKILEAFLPPVSVNERELHVTSSIGVSVYPEDGIEADMLLKHADVAMYRAKGQGRNCFQCYAPEMGARAVERVKLEHALHHALENNQFELHYQPQVDLKSGHVKSVEALIRWHHPELGSVAPNRFIPLAEETGLIIPIGEWVLKTACAQAGAWRQAGHWLTVAVNVSGRQFQQKNMPQLVQSVLMASGLDARCLELELTESMLMNDSEATVQILGHLKAIGVRLSIDDFGTGFSSLSYLTRFPIDIIKIDQSFISGLAKKPEAASITLAVIALAKALSLKTVAEGVETVEQLEFLHANGCDAIQGYYFSRPLPADQMSALLGRSTRLHLGKICDTSPAPGK